MVVPKAKKNANKPKLSVKNNSKILKVVTKNSLMSPKAKKNVKVSVNDVFRDF